MALQRDRDRVLSLGARRRLHRQVGAFPGLHLAELARTLGMAPNHAKYHLDRLERSGLVTSRQEGGFLVYFPKEEGSLGLREAVPAADKVTLALLRRPVPLHVVLLLLDRQVATHAELLREVDVAHGTLHYHLKKLEGAGVLVSERQGRERLYRINDPDRIERLLTRYKPPSALVEGFLDAWEGLDLSPGGREDAGPDTADSRPGIDAREGAEPSGRARVAPSPGPGGAAPAPPGPPTGPRLGDASRAP